MKRHASLLVLALLLLGFTTAAQAQDWKGRGRVQGIVTDKDTNKPIEGAKVTVFFGEEGQGPPEPVLTDKKGRWAVGGLKTGQLTILIDMDGYKGVSAGASVVSEGLGPGQMVRVALSKVSEEELRALQPKEKTDGPAEWVELGNKAMVEQNWAEARAQYQKALAAIEDKTLHPPILRGVVRTYYEQGMKEEALKTLEDTLAITPDDQDTLKLLVTLLMAEGREADAKVYQARITDEFKLDPNSLLNLGIQKFNAGNVDEALTYFERVVGENPDLADGYYYRGLAYLNKNRTAEAKADFQKLIDLNPNHPRAAEAKDFLAAL